MKIGRRRDYLRKMKHQRAPEMKKIESKSSKLYGGVCGLEDVLETKNPSEGECFSTDCRHKRPVIVPRHPKNPKKAFFAVFAILAFLSNLTYSQALRGHAVDLTGHNQPLSSPSITPEPTNCPENCQNCITPKTQKNAFPATPTLNPVTNRTSTPKPTSPAKCTLCKPSFYMKKPSTRCLPCPASCQSCSQNKCQSCSEGYYNTNSPAPVDPDDPPTHSCAPCDPNCRTCVKSAKVCTTCHSLDIMDLDRKLCVFRYTKLVVFGSVIFSLFLILIFAGFVRCLCPNLCIQRGKSVQGEEDERDLGEFGGEELMNQSDSTGFGKHLLSGFQASTTADEITLGGRGSGEGYLDRSRVSEAPKKAPLARIKIVEFNRENSINSPRKPREELSRLNDSVLSKTSAGNRSQTLKKPIVVVNLDLSQNNVLNSRDVSRVEVEYSERTTMLSQDVKKVVDFKKGILEKSMISGSEAGGGKAEGANLGLRSRGESSFSVQSPRKSRFKGRSVLTQEDAEET